MRFLVIDDDELSRELLAMLLGAEGHEISVAASGEEALERLGAIAEPCPEVILSDMQMPGLSGEALARALRGVAGDRMKLLAMSGSQPVEASIRAFDGFLLKPFSMEDLDSLLLPEQAKLNISAEDADRGTSDDCSNPNAPELNEAIYAQMAKMMPAKQLAAMYGMCVADTHERLGQMRRLVDAGDDEGYRKAAHTIKGGCGMIGAAELYRLAERAERDGLTYQNGLEIQALLEHFSHACDRLKRNLGKRW